MCTSTYWLKKKHWWLHVFVFISIFIYQLNWYCLLFQVPKSYSLNNQCEPSYSTLLQSGSGGNGQVSPDKGQLYTNLPPPASSGNKIRVLLDITLFCFTLLRWENISCLWWIFAYQWKHKQLLLFRVMFKSLTSFCQIISWHMTVVDDSLVTWFINKVNSIWALRRTGFSTERRVFQNI